MEDEEILVENQSEVRKDEDLCGSVFMWADHINQHVGQIRPLVVVAPTAFAFRIGESTMNIIKWIKNRKSGKKGGKTKQESRDKVRTGRRIPRSGKK